MIGDINQVRKKHTKYNTMFCMLISEIKWENSNISAEIYLYQLILLQQLICGNILLKIPISARNWILSIGIGVNGKLNLTVR